MMLASTGSGTIVFRAVMIWMFPATVTMKPAMGSDQMLPDATGVTAKQSSKTTA